jgi:hypothetical protein
MTEDQYREYLVALAKRHLRVDRGLRHFGPEGVGHLQYEIDRLSSTARLVRVVADRSENSNLLKELAQELQNTYVDHVIDMMDRSGVLAALDDTPDITFENLQRAAIPPEDAEFLRRTGVDDPEAEITLIIRYSQRRIGRSRDSAPSEIARQAQPELKRAAEQVGALAAGTNNTPPTERKKRKLFNGIGKILAGVVTGAGNILLAAGTIAAPNPATAYGVIGSSALAVGGICQGIGDLRGE